MVILETARLILRQFRLSDAEALNTVFGDPVVMRFGEGVKTQEWVKDWLRNCLQSYRQSTGIAPWAVIQKNTPEVIGYCGLFHFPDVCGQAETEVGYRLARTHWRQGYATEAASAVRDHALNTLGLSRLISMIDPQNVASVRVAEKLGMCYEKDVMLEGYTHPDHVYVIERTG